MAFGKKKKDEEIINIPFENLDIETDQIKVIDEFYDKKSRKIKTYTLPVIELIIILTLITAAIYTCINFQFVEGNVIGKEYQLGPFSVVSKDYEPSDYLAVGKVIYYDGEKNGFPIKFRQDYEVNTITKIQDAKVFVHGPSIKDIVVSKEAINYVIES